MYKWILKISEHWTKGNNISWPDICRPNQPKIFPFVQYYLFLYIHLYMIWLFLNPMFGVMHKPHRHFFIIFIPLPLTYTKHSMIFSPIIDTYYMPKNSGSYIQQVVECIKVYSTMMQCAFSGFFLGEPPSVFPVKATKKHQLNSSVLRRHHIYNILE